MKNQAKLSLKTQGVKGTSPKWTEKIGYIAAFLNDDGQSQKQSIIIDSFTGYGKEYKPRETNLITIENAGKKLFEGNFEQLTNKLTAKEIKLYYHKTDGGAEYLMDNFIELKNGEKEGVFGGSKYILRIDGNIKIDCVLTIK